MRRSTERSPRQRSWTRVLVRVRVWWLHKRLFDVSSLSFFAPKYKDPAKEIPNFKGASWTERSRMLCGGPRVHVGETAERSVEPAASLMNLCLAQ